MGECMVAVTLPHTEATLNMLSVGTTPASTRAIETGYSVWDQCASGVYVCVSYTYIYVPF